LINSLTYGVGSKVKIKKVKEFKEFLKVCGKSSEKD